MAAACCRVSGIPNQLVASAPSFSTRSTVAPAAVPVIKAILREEAALEKECIKRRSILAGVGTLASGLVLPRITSAEVVPEKFRAFVDFTDGYSYYYPSDWRDFDFIGCDSAFKDRNVALQHVRVSFIPTDKGDIRDLGPMEEVIPDLVKNVYAAPTQKPTIFDMLEIYKQMNAWKTTVDAGKIKLPILLFENDEKMMVPGDELNVYSGDDAHLAQLSTGYVGGRGWS